jgi:hypothetical protein
MSPAEFDERLELFFGDASDTLARVYARLRGVESQGGYQLAGVLTGPTCHYARTLGARLPWVDRGPGPSLLAEALVPEPCFWTPEMPQLYHATVELRRGDTVVARCDRMLGIRALGVTRTNLIRDGKRWVLRGARRAALAEHDLQPFHDAELAALTGLPSDALCRRASEIGVLLVARLDQPRLDELRRLARWPAVAIVTLPAEARLELAGLAHNLLFAASFDPALPIRVPDWAQVALVDVDRRVELAEELASLALPVLAHGDRAATGTAVADRRAQCDALQRALACRPDLAGRDFAGYIV